MQRSNVRRAPQRLHVIILVKRCFGVLKLDLFASHNLQRSAFALILIDKNSHLSTSNDFEDLSESAAAYPL
jgi:hypothetical protein